MAFDGRFSGRALAVCLLLAAAAWAFGPANVARAAPARPVVVELFTSQGCSSCPPADALLGKLTARKDVLAFSLPVTYWDMLGWKDTLASEANTSRQKAYAAAMGHGGVYTPQMIVDGVTDVVGSREQAVDAAIAARASDERDVPVTLRSVGGELHVMVGGGKANKNATIWLFHLIGKATVKIGSGENGGHTVTYYNIVREVQPIGMWKGQAVNLDLPMQALSGQKSDAVAVIVQQGGYGRIVGAAMLDGH